MKMRVRYTLNDQGLMVSDEVLSTSLNELLVAEFSPQDLTGSVRVVSGKVLSPVTGASLHDVKKKLKKALIEQGVQFSGEGRKKKVVTIEG